MEELSIFAQIGIVFGCILALAVMLVVILLFVAINYSVKIQGQDGDIRVKAVATCIFGAVRAVALYGDGDLKYKITAFGITVKQGIFGDKKKRKVKNKELKTSKEKNKFKLFMKKSDEVKDNQEPVQDTPNVSRETVIKLLEEQNKKESKKILPLDISKIKVSKKRNTEEPKKPKKTFKDKFNDFWAKLQKKVSKAKDYKEKAKQIKRALDTKTGQRAIKFIKIQLLKLFHAIKPDSIKGYVKYGTGDPCSTAKIYGIAAQASFLITDDQLVVEPDFENKCIDVDALIKGKLYLFEIIIIVIKIILNNDVSRIWKEIRRITNG